MASHKDLTKGEMHILQNWEVADTTARDALSVTASDEGKVCRTTGDDKFYVLQDYSAPTWLEIGGSGGGSGLTQDEVTALILSIG